MRPWFRILSIAALAIAGAAVLTAGAPAVLAYEEGAPGNDKVIKAWEPYGVLKLARKRNNEGGPVELPRPIEKPEQLSTSISPLPSAPDGGKALSLGSLPGGMPMGRGAAPAVDPAAQAERRIQHLIRRLG
jgi:hypothetical protein